MKPFDPESKGIVERMNGFMEISFLPGLTFASPTDFNRQLLVWLVGANNRRHATPKARPVDLWLEDQATMLALPPAILEFVGGMLLGEKTLDRVARKHASYAVSVHKRAWVNGVNITDSDHVTKAAALRHQFQTPQPGNSGVSGRDLADYDRMFGVTKGNND